MGPSFVAAGGSFDDARGEEWSLHCGGNHDDSATITLVHLAHVVRSTPSLHELGDLGRGEIAWRPNAESPWGARSRLSAGNASWSG